MAETKTRRRRSRQKQGGPQGLSQEEIVSVALDCLREEGLDSLSMRRLAEKLGVSPMATYRHFDSREALIDAVFDEACKEVLDYPDLPDMRWQDRLRLFCHRLFEVLNRYPGLSREMNRAIYLEYGSALIDRIVDVLISAGFSKKQAAARFFIIYNYVFSMSARDKFRAVSEQQLAQRDELTRRSDRSGFAAATEVFADTNRGSIFVIVLDTLIEMLQRELDEEG